MKTISKILIMVGILIFIGTAGASDMGGLAFSQIVNRVLTGLLFLASGNILRRVNIIVKKLADSKHEKIKTYPYLGEVK